MPQKLTQEEVIFRAQKIHGMKKYDYSLVKYKNCHSKIRIICNTHGIFQQVVSDHLGGHGCTKCYADSNRFSTEEFILKAIKKHGKNKYDYSLTNYIYADRHVKIICKIHGVFKQTPVCHLRGTGCRKCVFDSMKITDDKFLSYVNKIHDSKYTYDLSNYKNAKSIIRIICPEHGEFWQKAGNHYHGSGCEICSRTHTSKIESLWLDSLCIPKKFRNKVIFIKGKRYNLDAIDKDNKIIYEFYGDYWHGNPKVFNKKDLNQVTNEEFGSLYKATMKRENVLKNNGYTLITIWETDFKKSLK